MQAKLYTRTTLINWESHNPHPLPEIASNILSFLKRLDSSYLSVLDCITNYYITFKENTCPSQEQIAEQTKLSVRWVGKILADFHNWGIIAKNYRHLKTSLYKITGLLFNPKKSIVITRLIPSMVRWFRSLLPTSNVYRYSKFNYSSILYKQYGTTYLPETIVINYGNDIGLVNDISYRNDIDARNKFKREKEREKVMVENHMEIQQAVSQDYKSLEGYLTPSMRKAAAYMKMNLYKAAGMFGLEDAAIDYALRVVRTKAGLTSPVGFFFKVAIEYSRKEGLPTDYSFSKRLQALLKDYENQSDDIKFTPQDHQSNENSKSTDKSATTSNSSSGRSSNLPRKGSYTDREAALADRDWPEHMKLDFEPRGVRDCRSDSYEKWSTDPYYPWKVHPDTLEMLRAGFKCEQIVAFYFEEIDRWGTAAQKYKLMRDANKYSPANSLLEGFIKQNQERCDQYVNLISQIQGIDARKSQSNPEQELKSYLEGLKIQSQQTEPSEVV